MSWKFLTAIEDKKMIQQQTILKVTDNSGAKTVKCSKVLKGVNRRFAVLGNSIHNSLYSQSAY